jgi:hypothetical protein
MLLGKRERRIYEASKRPPRNEQVYARRAIFQIKAKMFREGFNRRFTRIVRRVARRVCDALLAACDDDGGRLAGFARLEEWRITVQAVDHAVQVRMKNLSSLVNFNQTP